MRVKWILGMGHGRRGDQREKMLHIKTANRRVQQRRRRCSLENAENGWHKRLALCDSWSSAAASAFQPLLLPLFLPSTMSKSWLTQDC